MKFLTNFELQPLERKSLCLEYRKLQRVIEGLTACNCSVCKVRKQAEGRGCVFDKQAAAKFAELQVKNVRKRHGQRYQWLRRIIMQNLFCWLLLGAMVATVFVSVCLIVMSIV